MNVDQAVPTAMLALRRTALLCVALMSVVVVASAFLRHLGASEALQAAWAVELALARQVHRVAATLALIGAVALVVLARRARSSHIALAWSLLGVGLLLSAVGVVAVARIASGQAHAEAQHRQTAKQVDQDDRRGTRRTGHHADCRQQQAHAEQAPRERDMR
jgi:hypothetical protein